MSAPTVPHPPWCDARSCWVYPIRDGGGTETFHRLVALGDPDKAAGSCIEIVSYVQHDPAGTVVEQSPPLAFLRDLDDVPMTAEQAGGVALALALAAAVLAGARPHAGGVLPLGGGALADRAVTG